MAKDITTTPEPQSHQDKCDTLLLQPPQPHHLLSVPFPQSVVSTTHHAHQTEEPPVPGVAHCTVPQPPPHQP